MLILKVGIPFPLGYFAKGSLHKYLHSIIPIIQRETQIDRESENGREGRGESEKDEE